MTDNERELVYRLGVRAYNGGMLDDALAAFRSLMEDGSTEPPHLSYYGLLMAVREKRVREGLELCERAVYDAPEASEAHRNLARLHAATGWRTRAADVLRSGLLHLPGDPGLIQELRRMSPRRKPFFSFLNRDNPLNKYVGLLRSQVASRYR